MLAEDTSLFLSGNGEMSKLMRQKDWGKTNIGTPDTWPKSLQALIAVILHSKFPMFIWWGAELTCFYNDAYRPSLGVTGKHPFILGEPAEKAWEEIWPTISPLIQQVLTTGESVWREDQLIPIFRNGTMEDVYWTFSYSKINDDNNLPGGVLVTCVETTEKVIDRQQLKETSELYSFSIDAASLGAWDYNPVTNKFRFNDRLREWLCIPDTVEADLDLAFEVIAEKDHDRVKNAITSAITFPAKVPYDIEYDIIHPVTKALRTVLARGKPFFNEKNEVYRFSGIMEDVTETYKAKQQLKQSEEKLKNLVTQAPVAICLLSGPDLAIDIANDHMIRLWGTTPDVLNGTTLFSSLPGISQTGLLEDLRQAFLTGIRSTINEREIKLSWPEGEDTSYQNFTIEPFKNELGKVESILVTSVDVTGLVLARKGVQEAEERARLAAEAGKVAIFDMNLHNVSMIGSKRLYEIFGFPFPVPHEYLVDRIMVADKPIRDAAINKAYITGKLFYEVRIITRSNEIRWIRADGLVAFSENRKPSRIIGTVLDITEKKEEDFKREEYIGIISHELRNPLTSLKLNAELISSASTKEEIDYYSNKIRQQADRLATITHELLNATKISSGLLDLNAEYFHLGNTIMDSVKIFDSKGEKNTFKFDGEFDVIVHADKFRIEQVLINLVSNASKYSPENSTITISMIKELLQVVVRVTDEGAGISEEKQSELFKKFFRVNGSGDKKGYGLGLYISQQIVIKHGGLIGVESEEGKGSTFWFSLPV